MANSLRAKLSKLRYDGHITDTEYRAFIKKFDGHEQEIRAKAIDEFVERLYSKIIAEIDDCADELEWINEIAEQMKAGGVE